ncbi:MAG: hypothetical protein ACTSUB_00985 [Candidatus Thorarchaeota archaeon]
MSDDTKKKPNFPILKGESVGESGEFSGKVVLVSTADELNQSWGSDAIVTLHHDLEKHFKRDPGNLDNLFKQVSAVLAEFGKPISEISAMAHTREIIAVVNIHDACYVLENDMHIRIIAHENSGEIFFID